MNYFKAVTASMSQDFGENKPCSEVGVRPFHVIEPLSDNTCPIGYEKFYQALGMKGHNGRDWRCDHENVYYPCEWGGWVRYDEDPDGGIGIDVVSDLAWLSCNEGCPSGTLHNVKYRAWHLSSRLINDGAAVRLGDLLAVSGNTGASSGPHLHDAVKWCDKNGRGIHTDNGYMGAIPNHQHLTFDSVYVLEAIKALNYATSVVNMVASLLNLVTTLWKRK